MKRNSFATLLLGLLLTSSAVPASQQPLFVFKDPNAQTPDWSQPLGAPFVDIFQLLPDNRLLVGAMAWDSGNFPPGELKLLSVADGSTLWVAKRESIPGAVYSLVGMQQEIVILQAVTAEETRLFGYGSTDGSIRWRFTVKGRALSAPIADTSTLVISATDQVTALDVTSGKPAWTRPVQSRVPNALAGILTTADIVCVLDKSIACVDRAGGTERWNKPDSDSSALGRAFFIGTKLITATDTGVTAWNVADGAQLWRVAAPVQGFVDITTDDATLYATWLDSSNLSVKLQAFAAADGKYKWTSEALPIPRSAVAITGDTGYFSSVSMLMALNLRTGKVLAKTQLPRILIDTDRKPDDVLVQKDAVMVFNDNGSATFAASDLTVQTVATMWQMYGSRQGAERTLKDEITMLSQFGPAAAPVAPVSLQLGQASALANAAQTRIQLAYAQSRPVLESPRSTHAQKAAAHGYIAQEISGAISMQKQAIRMEQMQAATNLAGSAVGFLQAWREFKRQREDQAKLSLLGYYIRAADLRNESVARGYAMNGGASRILVFDAARNSVGAIHHSSETRFGWTHVALLTEDRAHLIGAHVPHTPGPATTKINSEIQRADLSIERYPLEKAVWKPAEAPAVEDALITGIRSGKITSLKDTQGVCYMDTSKLFHRTREMLLAAIVGRNVTLLREMHVHGAFKLAQPSWDFNSVTVARDMMDPELVTVFEEAAKKYELDFELAKAVRQDNFLRAKAALSAGASADGLVPLSDTQTCNTPLLTFAPFDNIRKLLLESGAHINILNAQGQTPLDTALAQKNKSLERFLRKHGGKLASELPK